MTPPDFSQAMPLFPLPNCVLFPGVVQPLHLYEPRYLQMMEQLLADQPDAPYLALALLKPGWEPNYYGRPAIHEIVCAGRVVAHERLEDGKYNLLLHGVTRARVLREQRRDLYRVALLEGVADIPATSASLGHEQLQRKILRELFEKSSLRDLTIAPTLAALFEHGLGSPHDSPHDSPAGSPHDSPHGLLPQDAPPLSRLIDALAFALVQDVNSKQRLLEERDPLKRGEFLLQDLVALAARLAAESGPPAEENHWPPHLSVN